jgi:hypothetical protein
MIDGNADGNWQSGSCWHSAEGDTYKYWGVDMSFERRIK